MGEKIVVGPINKGLRTDRTAFVIDNDSFPQLINAYQWRGRIKRKRGTSFLGRLTRFFNSLSTSYNSGPTTITLAAVTGAGNLLTGFSLQTNGNIVPGSVTITVGINVYTDPAMDGTLSPSGTINYSSGAIAIPVEAGNAASATFRYYPDLPVMGLEEFVINSSIFRGTIAFDTKYSYNITTNVPFDIYDVSFYKNPAVNGTFLPGYVPKAIATPTSWNGQDYQQFWTVNYQGALWATNGVRVPFSTNNIGMQYKPINSVTVTAAGPPAIATINITNHDLFVGDFVFINEVSPLNTGIDFQTGYVIAVIDVNNVSVEFPFATLTANSTGGIAQYLTSRADTTLDCLRFYDGDPTDGNATNPTLNGTRGWVNFAPPLSQFDFSIADLPQDQYYLVGARAIVPFKDRLLFFGPVVQTSAALSQVYLKDTVIYSLNGTPYYTASFTGDPSSALTEFSPVLLPANQTSIASGYFADQTGFGGWISAGVEEPIVTVSSNEDVLIVGFSKSQTKLVYSGLDLIPFNFFLINSEYGSASTFSSIDMDEGVLTAGSRGYIITNQSQCTRFDLQIPDQVFQTRFVDNGPERITSQRDFINEWAYFTYPANTSDYKFPTQTIQYNYRDDSWGVFNESYTTYGIFRQSTGYTWSTIGTVFSTWAQWNDPWDAGSTTLLQPQVIGGNQQGFIVFRDDGTNESNSLTIGNISFPATITNIIILSPTSLLITANNSFVVGQAITITGVVGMTQVNNNTYTITGVTPTTITLTLSTAGFGAYISGGLASPTTTVYSPNHCLIAGDYITISGALGTIGAQVNGKIFSVDYLVTVNGFNLNPTLTAGTYLGGGLIKRMYVPQIQSKQFPPSWGIARKTRLGPQQYLLTKTSNAEITLQIFLSMNADNPYNVNNNALVNSSVLFTCPESTNLGLTPANINLQMVTAEEQEQIWHRKNISLLGDVVQVGFTLSDAQMRDVNFRNQFAEVEIHSFILDVTPSQVLA